MSICLILLIIIINIIQYIVIICSVKCKCEFKYIRVYLYAENMTDGWPLREKLCSSFLNKYEQN